MKNKYPEIAKAIDWLSDFSPSRLTGSGSCIFASFDCKKDAQEVLKQLPKKWHGFVAKGVNDSPLLKALS